MSLYGPEQLADSMRTVRKNTILIADDIPEASYGYRPTPESRSVAETFLHIAAATRHAEQIHVRRLASLESFSLGEHLGPSSKGEIISMLRAEGDRWFEWVEQMPESVLAESVRMPPGSNPAVKSRFEMLLGAKEHEIHHRAQLMVIERLLGIVPHLTRNRQRAAETTASRR